LHTSTGIAFISVKLSTNVDCSSIVSASTRVVGTFNLSRRFTCTCITVSQDSFPELHGSAHVLTIARIVGATDGSRRLTNTSVATILNSCTNV